MGAVKPSSTARLARQASNSARPGQPPWDGLLGSLGNGKGPSDMVICAKVSLGQLDKSFASSSLSQVHWMRFMYAVKLHLSDNARSDVAVASVDPTTSMRE